jgi:MFS family permease
MSATEPRVARVAWVALVLLSCAYTLSVLDRTVITFLLADIKRDLALDDVEVGLLQGFSHALFYGLLGLPIGRLADVKSRRTIIAIGLASWSLMTALCGAARGFGQLFAARVGVGVGEASLHPSAFSMIADYFPPQRLAFAMGIYTIGSVMGIGLAALLSGWVLGLVSAGGHVVVPLVGAVAGWQATFFVVSLPGFVLALVILFIPEPARVGALAHVGAVPVGTVLRFLGERWRCYGSLLLGAGLTTMVSYALMGWIPMLLVRNYGWAPKDVSLAYGLMTVIGGTLGSILGGLAPAYFVKRGRSDATLLVTIAATAVLGVFGAVAPLMASSTWFLAVIAPFMMLMFIPYVLSPAALQMVTPNQMRGQASAIFLLVATIVGMGGGPLLVGLSTKYLFRDEARLPWSLSLVASIGSILAVIVLAAGLAAFRRGVAEARQWDTREQG